MVPLKLTVKNFLCYGEDVPPLDFEGIHVACLCGQNGHGKSALLDAITWALWGKARGRTQEELIRYGYSDMLVELEFMARDTHYRAARRHSVSGRSRRRQGATDLQLQIYSGEGFHPITANSVRETQAKIEQITGMDYDTFINSAFLLQGRADEFTNKTAGERKEVLAKILGLDLYDRLQDKAKGLADEKRVAASIIESDLERMRLEVSRADGYQNELDMVKQDTDQVSSRLETGRQAMDTLKLRTDDLRRKLDDLSEIDRRIPAIEGDMANLQKDMDSRQERISSYQALLEERENIEAGLLRFQRLQARYEELNRSREEFDRLTKGKADLERSLDNQKARLEAHVTQLKRRIEGDLRPKADALPSLSRRMDEARLDLDNLAQEEGSIADKRQELQQLRARYEALNYAREQFDEMTREKASLERTLDSLKAQIEAHTAQLKRRIEGDLRPKADALPDLTTRMDQGRLELDNLAQEERGLEDKRQRLNGMASRIGELKAVTQQLTAEGLEIRSKLDMVQATHQDAQCPLCGTQLGPDGCERLVDNYTAQRAEKGRLYRQSESDLKAAEKEKADLDQELPKLEAALRRSQREAQGAMAVLQRQMEESTEAAAELESASRELAEESTRLEQGDFAEEERRQVAHLETRIMALGYDQAVHTRLYSEMQEMQLLTDRMEADLRLRERDAQGAVAVLQRRIEESTTAAAELDLAAGELAEEMARLEQDDFASEERRQLAGLEAEILTLDYDQAAHTRLYGEVQELQPYQDRYRRLEEAAANLPQEQESLERGLDMYQRRQEEIQALKDRQLEMQAEASELPGWEEKLREAEGEYNILEGRHGELFRRQVALENDLKRIEALERELDEKEKAARDLKDELGIYQELTDAFGKRGVQAMLIETVLPRVEDEANILLGRMTDNRMNLKLESQRERRSGRGEPIETLEIKISDEMGPRSYELFSGGEAFRINLALRIALSKVLAHRRGAPLPTLFIDEGFGTQDAAGRERILDVIRAIEEDFEKIIVITHLDELKEAFPARIEVQKEESGSSFWIS